MEGRQRMVCRTRFSQLVDLGLQGARLFKQTQRLFKKPKQTLDRSKKKKNPSSTSSFTAGEFTDSKASKANGFRKVSREVYRPTGANLCSESSMVLQRARRREVPACFQMAFIQSTQQNGVQLGGSLTFSLPVKAS